MMKRPFETDFHILKYRPRDELVCLDVGANHGQSIDAIKLFSKSAKIVSFEPNRYLAEKLTKRWSYDSTVYIEPIGLSDQRSSDILYVPKYYNYVYDGLASFDRDEATDWLNAETVAAFNPQKLEILEYTCRSEALDALNLVPDFLKIDVQGFERAVLAGGSATIRKHAPLIMLENNPAADEYLRACGWHRHAFNGSTLVKGEYGSLNTFYLCDKTKELWPDLRVIS